LLFFFFRVVVVAICVVVVVRCVFVARKCEKYMEKSSQPRKGGEMANDESEELFLVAVEREEEEETKPSNVDRRSRVCRDWVVRYRLPRGVSD
jgi:hypothetical protein